MEGKKLILQPRLQALADCIPAGARIADVGTDHGYLPVHLLQEKKISFAIASDINSEPLEHARRTAAQYDIHTGIDFRLCDGLGGIGAAEVDMIVIAGMGGETIASILTDAKWVLKSDITLLLQPMSKQEFLRQWLTENGYHFLAERLVRDKEVLYPIYVVKAGVSRPLTPGQIYGGVLLREDPLAHAYLTLQIHRLQRACAGLAQAKDMAAREKAEEIRRILSELQTAKEAIDQCQP